MVYKSMEYFVIFMFFASNFDVTKFVKVRDAYPACP